MNDMENKNASTTTDDGLKEIDKQTNPVTRGWGCPICGRVFSLCIRDYRGDNNMNHITCKDR